MSGMTPFTYDAESIELTADDQVEYAGIVGDLCHMSEQRQLSMWLAETTRPHSASVCDSAQRKARRLWRTALGCS